MWGKVPRPLADPWCEGRPSPHWQAPDVRVGTTHWQAPDVRVGPLPGRPLMWGMAPHWQAPDVKEGPPLAGPWCEGRPPTGRPLMNGGPMRCWCSDDTGSMVGPHKEILQIEISSLAAGGPYPPPSPLPPPLPPPPPPYHQHCHSQEYNMSYTHCWHLWQIRSRISITITRNIFD